MSDKITSNEIDGGSSQAYHNLGFQRDIDLYDSNSLARAALYKAVREIDTKNDKRHKQVQQLRFLIYELKSLQPADLNEISESLGQSHTVTLRQLKKLRKLDLVVRTRFEHHTLYCINGDFNQFIEDILESFYFGNEVC
jgi:hypothetical protein